jgi:hypothetical protein
MGGGEPRTAVATGTLMDDSQDVVDEWQETLRRSAT